MLVAFEEMGVKLNRFNPAEDMRSIRFLLRDTQLASEAKKDTARFHKRIAEKRGTRELKNPVDAYPGRWCDFSFIASYVDTYFYVLVLVFGNGLFVRWLA